MELSYEKIEPLVHNVEVTGMQVKVLFKAENQEQPVMAYSVGKIDQDKIVKSAMKNSAKSAAGNGIISFLSRMLGGFIGGAAGSAVSSTVSSSASSAVSQKMSSKTQEGVLDQEMSQEGINECVVNAFQSVQNLYTYDETAKKWSLK